MLSIVVKITGPSGKLSVTKTQHILSNPELLLAYREASNDTVFVSEDWAMHEAVIRNQSVEIAKRAYGKQEI